uniref:RRM domain-containing protein n=1 Tax=Strix occidentalis caurina TaxID=311401 RepID=A0A8D0FC37_STROC
SEPLGAPLGTLGRFVNDEILGRAFGRFPSFLKAKVIRDKRTGKTKGYGFVSFKDPGDYVRAMREMNGTGSLLVFPSSSQSPPSAS